MFFGGRLSMNISFSDAYFQTALFLTFLVPFIILTLRKDKDPHVLSPDHTNELKGVAILMVIFSHIGYLIFSDHDFLYPLSIAGGVGVNIFLFLSGFGLVSSELKSKKTIFGFYAKRLRNIFVPMWLVLILVFLLDFYILHRTYPVTTIVHSVLGFFPSSDIDFASNSPLWYFSLILFYYLIFPLVFNKKSTLLSAAVIFLLSYFMITLNLPVTKDVLKLYALHLLAFPFGMIFVDVMNANIVLKIKNKLTSSSKLFSLLRNMLLVLFSLFFVYTCINSGVGERIRVESFISSLSLVSLVFIFLLKRVQSDLLITFGKYSYEIYLIQWPLMYRYDFIYKYTQPFLGTLLYLGAFLVIGYVLNKVVKLLLLPFDK